MSVEISEFAEKILFGSTLSDKIDGPAPGQFCDKIRLSPLEKPPQKPARPVGLEFATPRQGRHRFPSKASLEDPVTRGRILHFFANHELLALELMALALLRFPEAPAPFRLGLVHTMLEEQSHLKAYLGRMAELGVGLGDLPVNGFFWDCLKDMHSPLDYVTHMSLTFEQANLDFSRHYMQRFRAIGDDTTADILTKVYLEEIGHVRHGVQWFERWRDPQQEAFTAYAQGLKFPVSPARAKGQHFDREGRLKAGLTPAFIDALDTYSQSKGRPPQMFFFDGRFESDLITLKSAKHPDRARLEVEKDFSHLMMFLAQQDDVVVTPEIPSQDFLLHLKRCGFSLPEFILGARQMSGEISLQGFGADRHVQAVSPWGWSKAARGLALQWSRQQDIPSEDAVMKVARKDFLPRVLKTLSAKLKPDDTLNLRLPEVFTSREDLLQAAAEVSGPFLIKAPLGAGGQGMLRFRSFSEVETKHHLWLDKILALQGSLLLEPWYPRLLDLTLLFQVDSTDKNPEPRLLRSIVDKRGQYRGHVLGRNFTGLPRPLLSQLFGGVQGKKSWKETMQDMTQEVAVLLREEGYRGPVGIDAFIYGDKDADDFRLRPLCEINTRYTMGWVAAALEKKIIQHQTALWMHLNRADLAASGFASYEELVQEINKNLPLEILSKPNGGINRGAVATSDAARQPYWLTILLVGQDLEEIFAALPQGLSLRLKDYFVFDF